MGHVLDSTVIIAAERAGKNPKNVIDDIAAALGDTEVALSVVTVIEMSHGIQRANSPERRSRREYFLNELLSQFAIEHVTVAIAFRAGQIDGALQAKGIRVALADLLIGTTALELGYSVVTNNIRHFQLIPNLQVKQL